MPGAGRETECVVPLTTCQWRGAGRASRRFRQWALAVAPLMSEFWRTFAGVSVARSIPMHSPAKFVGSRLIYRYLAVALAGLVLACSHGAPGISRQPSGGAVGRGSDLTLSVEATGSSPLRYQWHRDGAPLAGQNSPTLWLRDATDATAGSYHVVVADGTGSTSSEAAVVAAVAPQAPFWEEALTTFRRVFHDTAGRVYFLYNQGEPYANTLGGRLTSRLVRLHEATGAIDESFQWDDRLGVPTTLAVRSDHGLYVAVMLGIHEGGTILKVDQNGVVDAGFVAPRFDRMIRHLTLQPDGKLLVSFDSVAALMILSPGLVITGDNALYRLNTDGGIDGDFPPLIVGPGTTFSPRPQLDGAGRIYLSYFATTIQGVSTRGVFRLSPSGVVDASFPDWSSAPSGISANVSSFVTYEDGSVVLAGRFSGVVSEDSQNPVVAVRFAGDGRFDTAFQFTRLRDVFPAGYPQSDYPRAVVLGDDGGFALVGKRWARFSASGTLLAAADLGLSPGAGLSRSLSTGHFFVPASVLNDVSAGFSVFAPDGSSVTGFAPGKLGRATFPTSAISLNERRVLVAGSIDRAGEDRQAGTALFDRDGRLVPGLSPFQEPLRTIYDASASVVKWPDDKFLLFTSARPTPTGDFFSQAVGFQASGQKDPNWGGAGGYRMEPAPGGGGFIWSIPSIYSLAYDSSDDGANLLKRFNDSGQIDPNFRAELPDVCRLIDPNNNGDYRAEVGTILGVRALSDGGVFVALVTYAGELRIVKLCADGSRDLSYVSPVLALVPRTDGNFYFVEVSLFRSATVRGYLCFSHAVDLVALPDGSVFVTGLFTPEGRPSGIARLNPDGSYDAGFTGSGLGLKRPGLLPIGTRLALDAAGRVYLAGRFDSVNGHVAPGLARFLADGTLDRDWRPGVEVHDDLLERPVLVADGDWLHVFGDVRNPGRPHTAGYLRVLLDPAAPNILAPPTSVAAREGARVTFNVAVEGTAPFTYQWYRGPTPLPNTNSPEFILTAADVTDADDYSVQVSNGAGRTTSAAATLTVTVPQSQILTFGALPDVAFTRVPLTLSATSTSGLPVEFAVVSGAASIVGNQLTLRGVGPVTIRATQSGDATFLAATPIERTFRVTPNFLSWQVDRFTDEELVSAALTGAEADYDRDGFSNLVEYALGGDPKNPTGAIAPEIASPADEWTFTYTRPADRADVSYHVEISTDLATWTTSDVTLERIATGERETWRARVPHATSSVIFFRLRVER